jgi:hypothetical protein
MKKLAYILPFLFLFTPLFAQAALTDNIAAYWKFDEGSGTTAADAVGGNDGTLTGSPSWTTSGLVNDAITYNGSSQYTKTSSGLSVSSAFTVALWVNPSVTLSSSGDYGIFEYGTASASKIAIELNASGGSARLLTPDLSNTSYYADSSYVGVTSFNANTWYFIVLIYDGSTKKLYANGATDSHMGVSATGTIGSGTQFMVGGDQHGSSGAAHYFPGTIDEVGIWSRALTATEISQLYNSGAGLQYPFATPVATPAPARKMRLFEGFKLKLLSGKMILYQQ